MVIPHNDPVGARPRWERAPNPPAVLSKRIALGILTPGLRGLTDLAPMAPTGLKDVPLGFKGQRLDRRWEISVLVILLKIASFLPAVFLGGSALGLWLLRLDARKGEAKAEAPSSARAIWLSLALIGTSAFWIFLMNRVWA